MYNNIYYYKTINNHRISFNTRYYRSLIIINRISINTLLILYDIVCLYNYINS